MREHKKINETWSLLKDAINPIGDLTMKAECQRIDVLNCGVEEDS